MPSCKRVVYLPPYPLLAHVIVRVARVIAVVAAAAVAVVVEAVVMVAVVVACSRGKKSHAVGCKSSAVGNWP